MALTLVARQNFVTGAERTTVYDITGDSSYPAGGYTINPRDVGLTTRIDMADSDQTVSGSNYNVDFTPSGNGVKMKVVTSNGAAPAAFLDFTNTGNLSTLTVRVKFVGQ